MACLLATCAMCATFVRTCNSFNTAKFDGMSTFNLCNVCTNTCNSLLQAPLRCKSSMTLFVHWYEIYWICLVLCKVLSVHPKYCIIEVSFNSDELSRADSTLVMTCGVLYSGRRFRYGSSFEDALTVHASAPTSNVSACCRNEKSRARVRWTRDRGVVHRSLS